MKQKIPSFKLDEPHNNISRPTDLQNEKIIMWNETGLELKNSSTKLTNSKQSKLHLKTTERKTFNTNCLTRNIDFVSSRRANICE